MWEFQKNILKTKTNVAGTPPVITIIDEQINANGCTNCKTVTVYVPSGSRDVEVAKIGAGLYSSGTLDECAGGTNLTADGITNITTTTTFRFGIDAASGNELGDTTIYFTVKDTMVLVGDTSLERIHSDPVQVC